MSQKEIDKLTKENETLRKALNKALRLPSDKQIREAYKKAKISHVRPWTGIAWRKGCEWMKTKLKK